MTWSKPIYKHASTTPVVASQLVRGLRLHRPEVQAPGVQVGKGALRAPTGGRDLVYVDNVLMVAQSTVLEDLWAQLGSRAQFQGSGDAFARISRRAARDGGN